MASLSLEETQELLELALAENARLRSLWEDIAQEIIDIRRHRMNKGGQQCGIPMLSCCPPSILNELAWHVKAALGEGWDKDE